MAGLKGDDPAFDLPDAEKADFEARLRDRARGVVAEKGSAGARDANRMLRRAKEVSRRRSKSAHQGRD